MRRRRAARPEKEDLAHDRIAASRPGLQVSSTEDGQEKGERLMRGTRDRGALLRLATIAGASVVAAGALAGTGGAALADPLPRPPGRAQAKRPAPAQAGQPAHPAGKGPARHAGRHHHRPRTVVRCQNDDTDQLDEIDDDGDEPRHYVAPGSTAPSGGCAQDALNLAGLLAGDHRTRARTARRPVR
jgi:hypothetical protein